MMKKNARFNYLLCIYLAGIVFFTLFRLGETIAYCAHTEGPDDFGGQYLHALWNGFRFDTAVSTYLLALPLLLLIIGEVTRFRRRWYYAVIHYLLMVLYTIVFFGCAADIPYFCGFFTHIDVAALGWMDTFGTMAGSIIGEPEYVLYLLIFIAITVGWWLVGRVIFRRVLCAHLDKAMDYKWSIPISLLTAGLLFLGMRGSVTKFPIRISSAYFCNDPFLNQIGVNPVFSFFKSIEDAGKDSNRPVQLIDAQEAAEVWQEQRAWPVDEDSDVASLRLPERTNIVIVIMESMSAEKTTLYGKEKSLTPCLDSLMGKSLTFTEAYSSGIHTHNGIFSTLYSYPAILARQVMRNNPIPHVYGLPQALGAVGYKTVYFVGYDENYDNMQGFLYQNGFDLVMGEHSYPKNESKSTWGLPDHLMFNHVIDFCDSSYSKGPFLACCMTCSDHTPYYLPDDININFSHTELADKMVEYADWSLGHFIRQASVKPWFENTLFVFVADHGEFRKPTYDMSLAYNHTPLLFYAPRQIQPRQDDRLAMQVDIAPTILGLLGMEVPQSMLGINLLSHKRPYAYFSADDKIGCVDGEFFYIYRHKAQNASLYRYKERSTVDIIDSLPDRAEKMRRYALGMTQTFQQMLLGD